MDKYHIYEEIGKGEFSQVFKGREKKKIEYVAIKRIEKSVMQKIVSEVQIMHKLNSAHILRFYDWYETRNNLWLILEYCTGGDLECILKQDGHLPETSVKIFGLDILAGVKYLHSQGLIHCDLKPKNFLVDEYGILKLADFKLVQKIPTKLLSESQLPLEARGSPPYMAPEIITGEGLHSYQSDLWSIGCMLYELRRGTAPFGDQESSIGDLVARIRSIEPVSSPLLFRGKDADKKNAAIPPISAELADLVQWLLEKAPINRCTWVELSDHPFWGHNKPNPPTSLPPQHVFDALVRDQEKHRTQQIEMDTNREFGVLPSVPGSNISSTPLKLPVSESTPIRPTVASRAAVVHAQHQQPEVEVPVVVSPSKQADEKISTRQDIRTLNMESSAKIISGIESKWNDEKSHQEAKRVGLTRVPSEERIINLSIVEEKSVVIETQPVAQKKLINAPAVNASPGPSGPSVYATPQAKDTPSRPSTATRDERKDLFDSDGEGAAQKATSPLKKAKVIDRSKPNDDLGLITLLVHPSDTQVKPIVGNKAIEVVETPGFNDEALPFDVLSLDELLKLSPVDVEYHLTQVHKCLNKTIPVAQSTTPTQAILVALQERVNALGYLCSIASAEIANVVLNTPFLALILKLMKAIPQYNSANAITANARTNTLAANSRGSTLSNGIATLTANVVTVATASRTLAATALAMLLRFATRIQPPTIRLREEHIIPSVVALLKETQRMDPKFKRRAVAALGETIFYITAQEEDSFSQEGVTERWVIPNSAIDMMSRCLRDDADEIIRHYAAKTIENVMAQGGLEYRRRFATFDIAVRLLELSQSSKSEALQASSGMALAHMFLFIMTPNNLPPLSTTGGFNGELSTTITKKTGLNATIAPPNIPDPFVYPVPVSGAKFIAKVLEKGGLSGILETLKDGQPKLQQAYLSILNVIFCSPINLNDYCNISVDDFSVTGRRKTPSKKDSEGGGKPSDANAILQAVNVSLRLTRQYFIKSALMIPLVIKLIDQGATSAIRGKAFIAAQLLCKLTPPSLATLGERRLPSILVKLLEPILSHLAAEGPGAPPIELSYVAKTAICMVNHIRDVTEESSQTIVELFDTLIQSPTLEIRDDTSSQAGQSVLKTPEPSPDKMAMRNRKTPQSAAPLKNTPGASSAAAVRNAFDISKLRAATEMLLSAISIASLPGLRKLILALDGQFVFNLSEALKRLPSVHAALAVHGLANVELQDALESVEQACLISLETLSQVDLLDDGSSAGPPSLSSARNNLSPPPKTNQADRGAKLSTLQSLQSEEGWEFFAQSYVLNLIPAVCVLMNHHSGNVRATVASSLRRLLPSAVRMCLLKANQDVDSPLNQEVAMVCINQYVSRVSVLLSESAPIPQYAVRVLSDVALISKGVTLTVVHELRRYEVCSVLVNMLRDKQDSEDGGETGENSPVTVDPQLIALFRTLFDYNEGAVLLLECDFASALCHALLRLMYAPLDLTNDNTTESIQMLVDLLFVVLQFVLQSLAKANSDAEPIGPRAMPKAEKQYNAEQNRRMVAPLRAVVPALLLVFVKVDQFYDYHGPRRHDDLRGASGDDFKALCAVLNHLVDCSSICLALLFDLFQEASTNQLLSKQSVLMDAEATAVTIAGYEDYVTPRMVLAKLLGNAMMESKVKARILKIIHAVCKLVISSNAKPRAQEFLCQEPLFPTLQKIFKTYNSREALGNAAENAAFAKLVLQILDYANSM